MFSNIFISLEVLIHLNFVLSFKHPAVLISFYERDAVIENKNHVCETNIILKATGCRRILQLLRQDNEPENPYRDTLYMDYTALLINDNCVEKEIFISENRLDKRSVLPCFSRPPVIFSDTHIQKWPHIDEIFIYSGSNFSIVVLQCLVFCILLEWFQEEELGLLTPVASELFSSPVPQSIYSEELEVNYMLNIIIKENKFLEMSLNFNNIMMKMNGKEVEQMCYLMFKRPQLMHKFYDPPNSIKDAFSGRQNVQRINTKLKIFQQEQTDDRMKFRTPNDVPAFSCKKFQETGRAHLPFKIMLGPTNTSVILLEPADYQFDHNNFRKYKPIEMIEYLEIHNTINIDTNY